MLGWLMAGTAAFFFWISLSMYISAFKTSDPAERNNLMKKGFGPLVLALMGVFFAWYSFNPPAPPG